LIGLAEVGAGQVDQGLADVDASLAALADAANRAPDDHDAAAALADAAATAADALLLAGRADAARAACGDALARAMPLQRRALFQNDVRRAKLLLCAQRAAEAGPLLQRLDAAGYHDGFLDRLRQPGSPSTHGTAQAFR
jgi:hypothetical protein